MFASHRRNIRQVKVGERRDNVYLFLVVFWKEAKTHAKRFVLKPYCKEREKGCHDTEVRSNPVEGLEWDLSQGRAAQ
jgi:hypothetical protein